MLRDYMPLTSCAQGLFLAQYLEVTPRKFILGVTPQTLWIVIPRTMLVIVIDQEHHITKCRPQTNQQTKSQI